MRTFKCKIDLDKEKDLYTPLYNAIANYEYYSYNERPSYIIMSRETFYKCICYQYKVSYVSLYSEVNFETGDRKILFEGIPVALDFGLELGEIIVV